MSSLSIRLFGRFTVQSSNSVLVDLGPPKVQELLAYLLVHRDRAHHREILADVLHSDRSSSKSRKCLRQSLWRLHCALRCSMGSVANNVLVVEPDWVRMNPEAELWIDVKVFEDAFTPASGIPGELLGEESVRNLEHAVRLYAGDLLEGWYHDWCVYERQRLQQMYLAMLDKLMEYCETRQEYESGLLHGARVLRHEPARERTHRRLMRLHYKAGDRTAALRQYERCVAALRTDLEVDPAKRTEALCELIRADEFDGPALR